MLPFRWKCNEMANVQWENGFTKIANEILESLVKVRLPPSEKDLILFIIRKTYGFNKKEDRISLTQFEAGTDLSRPTVVKALKNLISRKMIVKAGLLIKFNKDYEKWVVNAGLLVKSRHEFGKGGFTKTSKGGFTYKRKKENKRNISEQSSDALKKKMDVDYNTGLEIPERAKSHKREDVIKLALLFDRMASEYSKRQIITPKSYFIVLGAINTHKLKPKGIIKLYEDWFNDDKTKMEDKVKMSWCLGKNNINAFKVKN